MIVVDDREDSDKTVELLMDEETKECEIFVRSESEGVFGIFCGTDRKLAVEAFHHPFAYRRTIREETHDLLTT